MLILWILIAIPAPDANANTGYEPDAVHPHASLPGLYLRGMAVDQGDGEIYVAITSTNIAVGAHGEILRFTPDLSADGEFGVNNGFYSGVALNAVSGGFFASQMEIRNGFGNFGTSELDKFDSGGASIGSFPIAFTDSLPPIAADPSGHIYIPNVTTHSVQVYSSAGTLLSELTCAGCPGGSFGAPSSVALDASGDLYVVDTSPDRVIKLVPSAGSFSFGSTVESGHGAGAVAVDPGDGDIFVGDMPGGNDFHVVVYDSSGAQLDDFGAGMFPDTSSLGFGVLSTYQMAADGSSHELYVASKEGFYAFEKTTIPAPSATIEPAAQVGQLGAILDAIVNANGHAVLECEFEYVGEAEFLADGFTGASQAPCLQKPDGTADVEVTAQISGLSPSSSYRYRLTARSNGGTVVSGDQSFETLPELAAVVTTEAAQSIGQTTAKLEAKVNPRGGTVSDCHFELGIGLSYGTNLSCLTPVGEGSTGVSESRVLSGLSPATTYHYRLAVTTNAGTSVGSDIAFMTTAAPSEPGTPPTPSPSPGAPESTPPAVPPPPAGCPKGLRPTRVDGRTRCLKACPKGTRRKLVHGKARCLRKHRSRRQRRHLRAHG